MSSISMKIITEAMRRISSTWRVREQKCTIILGQGSVRERGKGDGKEAEKKKATV